MGSQWIRMIVLLAVLLVLVSGSTWAQGSVPLSKGGGLTESAKLLQPSSLTGTFCVPTTGLVTQRYKPSPPYPPENAHYGVDIASGPTPGVTPVYAAYAGRVVFRGTMNTASCYPLDP